MPDETHRHDEAAERDAEATDAGLIGRVRLRLVAWSGGVTLIVLLALGVALYVAVAQSLGATGAKQLEDRADAVQSDLSRGRPRLALGFGFGGDPSGALALVVASDGETVLNLPPGLSLISGLPVADGVLAAQRSGTEDLRDVTLQTSTGPYPMRVLSRPLSVGSQNVVVQVLQSRAEEQRTLDTTLAVLLVGGLIALLVASGFGAVYARRALVPIRQSLSARRAALSRQREFAADASHELRTPLTVIRSSVDHLRRHRDEPVATVGDALGDIDAEVSHLSSLVEDLLLLARSDSGAIALDRVPVDLGDIATDAASSLAKPASDRGVRVVVDPEPAVVTGDPARLRQLVLILVDNAVRYSPAGGEVHITVRRESGDALLAVEDQGRGIHEEDLPRVFDRFWRAPGAPSGGTGLGLAIAKWIVERHGGRIEAANRPTGGARLLVRVPEGASTG